MNEINNMDSISQATQKSPFSNVSDAFAPAESDSNFVPVNDSQKEVPTVDVSSSVGSPFSSNGDQAVSYVNKNGGNITGVIPGAQDRSNTMAVGFPDWDLLPPVAFVKRGGK